VGSVATLNADKDGELAAVSCASAGNCGGSGHYRDATGTVRSFVVTETGGTWTGAKEVPGSLPPGGQATEATAESCPAAGRCTITGFLVDSGSNTLVYVDSQAPNHAWGTASLVPGLPTTGFIEHASSLACRSPGNCVVGGYMQNLVGTTVITAWVANEVNGLWHPAQKVAAALNKGNEAFIEGMSCGSPGNCVAVGGYSPAINQFRPFIKVEKNGAWQPAIILSGVGTEADLNAVSCTSAGNCTAGGVAGNSSAVHAIVLTEKNGKWGKPTGVPGMAALDVGHEGSVSRISCVSPGNCAAAGIYQAGNAGHYVWVAGQRNGVWGNAAPVANLNALSVGKSTAVTKLSCATLGWCGMVGYYIDGSAHTQPWMASGAIALPTTIKLALSTGTVRLGHEEAEKISVSVTAANGRRPPGKVTVKAGPVTLCVISLSAGAGSCRLGASRLRPGSYTVAAVYDGSHDYQSSNVAKKPLRVTT
jgi:hypothetical protein